MMSKSIKPTTCV